MIRLIFVLGLFVYPAIACAQDTTQVTLDSNDVVILTGKKPPPCPTCPPPDTVFIPPDTTPEPPDTTTPPPQGFNACDGLPTPLRTVNATPSSLASHLSGALAGDRIVLAPGTYSSKTWSNRDGTQARPIVLCGPSTAVFSGDLRPTGIDWWIFQGFTSRGAFQAFYAKTVTHVRLRGVEISNVSQEAVHFLCNSTDNVIEGNHIHNTGRTKPTSGEAVYLGTYAPDYAARCGTSAVDASNRNQLLNNQFGPNVSSEDLDAKEGTRDGVVRGNTSNGAGKLATSGHFEASLAFKGNTSGYVIEDNTLNPAAQNGTVNGNGIFLYNGSSGHAVRDNTINMQGASGRGIRIDGSGGGHICAASNVVANGTRSNVTCTAP